MTPATLKALFSKVLRASFATPLVLASCGPPSIDPGKYELPVCDAATGSLAVSGLAPSVIPDLVQLRQIQGGNGGGTSTEQIRSTSGTACATATNPPTCTATLAALKRTAGFRKTCSQICTDFYLASTTGDEVKAIDTVDALKAFLGVIDTPQEAVLLAFSTGLDIACGDAQHGAVRRTPGGFEVIGTKGFACGEGTQWTRNYLTVTPSGDVTETKVEVLEVGRKDCAIGRRPDGLQAVERHQGDTELGVLFASAAHLEAASVRAFVRLQEELALHRASPTLQTQALQSAAEEVEHAELTLALARRFGGTPALPVVEDRPLRSLFALAKDNAVEGCVRETYGALIAHHQAQHAVDDEVRAVMVRIAEDETRHASLSWEIHAWAMANLTAAEREEVRGAQRRAIAELRSESSAELSHALVTSAGMPDSARALAMLDGLTEGLWA